MTPFIVGLRFAIFAVVLAILIFFLKVICPIDSGCLVDPFLIVLFAPLTLFKIIGISAFITAGEEPLLIVAFWAVMGFVVGFLLAPLFRQKKKLSSETESSPIES